MAQGRIRHEASLRRAPPHAGVPDVAGDPITSTPNPDLPPAISVRRRPRLAFLLIRRYLKDCTFGSDHRPTPRPAKTPFDAGGGSSRRAPRCSPGQHPVHPDA
ncbi:hypothetical protein [Streptomyces sp. NPDC051546]|uniref:hypothetical protein n=1 Tax=Streptomyces sp. NPDC051546 TaxID=3365655 RepID=UPI0037B2D217